MPALELGRALQTEGTAFIQSGEGMALLRDKWNAWRDVRDVAGKAARANPSPTCVLQGVAWVVLCRWKEMKESDVMGFAHLNEHFASGIEPPEVGRQGSLTLETWKLIWELWQWSR